MVADPMIICLNNYFSKTIHKDLGNLREVAGDFQGIGGGKNISYLSEGNKITILTRMKLMGSLRSLWWKIGIT